MALVVKDPDAQIDYAIDWGSVYGDGQVVIASEWRTAPVEPNGLAVESAGYDLLETAARISGGVTGRVYRLVNAVTLSDGQRDERSIAVRVDAR